MASFTYVTADFPPYQRNAPAIRSLYHVKALGDAGHSCCVLTYVEGDPEMIVASKAQFRSTRVRPPSNKSMFAVRFAHELLFTLDVCWRLLRMPRPDWVVISSPPFFMTLAVAAVCVVTGVRFCVDVRDIYPSVLFDARAVSANSVIGRFLGRAETWLYRRATAVLTVTEDLVRFIKEKCGASENVHLVRNGFPEEFADVRAQKRSRFTFIMHGNLGQFQDIDLINRFAAFLEASVPMADFVIIGDGSQSHRLLLTSNCFYSRKVPFSEVPQLLASAHVGVSFRTNDFVSRTSFPVRVYEYIGAGLPVLVVPRGEAGEMLAASGGGAQFSHDEFDALTSMAAQLVQDRSYLADKMHCVAALQPCLTRERQGGVLVQILTGVGNRGK